MSTVTRRRFVQSLGAIAVAPAVIRGRAAERARLPIGFSTLGCPEWPLATILDVASREGYAAIELRGLQGEMDLPKRPEFSTGVAATLADLRARDLKVACLGSSAQLSQREPDERARQMDEARRGLAAARNARCTMHNAYGTPVSRRPFTVDRQRPTDLHCASRQPPDAHGPPPATRRPPPNAVPAPSEVTRSIVTPCLLSRAAASSSHLAPLPLHLR